MDDRRSPRVPRYNQDQYLSDKGYKKGFEEALLVGNRRKAKARVRGLPPMTREEVIAALAERMTSALQIKFEYVTSVFAAEAILNWLDEVGYTAQFLDEDNGNGLLEEGLGEAK